MVARHLNPPGRLVPERAGALPSRFFDVTFPAPIEPLQDAVRTAAAGSAADVVLVIHDWSMLDFHTHTRKTDCYQRSHDEAVGYDLGTALVGDAASGRPLESMEFRVRTASGLLAARPGGAAEYRSAVLVAVVGTVVRFRVRVR